MSRTNIEFLFQVTGAAGDRAFCTMPRADELLPPFGDHLNKAASTVLCSPAAPARTDDRPIASDSASNGNGSPKESSQSEAPAVNARADDRDDPETDELCGPDKSCATETSNVPDESAEASAEAKDGGESDEDEKDEETTDELAQAAATGIETNGGRNAAAVTTIITLQQSTAVVEGAKQSESTTDPTNIQAFSVGAKKSTSAKSTATTENESHDDRNELSGQRDTAVVANGDAIAKVEAAEPADESSNPDQPLNALGQSNESESGTDEPRRDASARSAGRQRVDAEAIVNKVATTAVANSIAPPPRDDDAVTDSVDKATQTTRVGATKVDGLADAGNRLHANSGAGKGAGRANSADEMPRVDPARFVGRVAKAFHTAQERGGTLQLRLSPPELGAMRLELTVKDGVLTASLETETASARRVLLEHLPALRERLAEQNFRVERFDVDVRREGGGQADPRASQDRQSPQQGHPERRQPTLQQRESAIPRQNAAISQPLTDTTGINLVA